MKRRNALAAVLGPLLSSVWRPAQAQAWPQRPLRLVVSFAPGGPADIVGRLVGQALQERLKQSVVIENRTGAGGNLAAKYVAGVPADGYTLLVTTSSMAVNQTLYKDPGYNALRDFTPIVNLAASPNILVVHPSDPAPDLKTFLAQNKGKPVSYGSAGVGSTPHLTADHVLRVLGKLDAVHVPFQGAAPALNAAMANQVPVASVALPPAVPLVKAGRVRALAVTSLQRIPSMPQVPTVAESGFPDFEDYTWTGLFGPAGLPAEIVATLNAAANEVLRQPDLSEKLAAAGLERTGGTPAEFAAYLQREVAKWGRIVKETGISAQ
ncbi:tripartite tricarboxylate transporter substrate binding protein [Aquabacterium sp. J223]|uniref:Bug family tripartite tricarboxylate transporter substrate binding protein n=1 Tax=Aquabacterium sp. J223 TaxID=2898431 RepID=UPI0021ADDB3D|nr:tripartite tricarboxylate transporter substrate binding protein [Aquabacterium sp. J223]UUX97246.1 tripartite tricarboxylate transporter substrate binding protein [Aquabacterium sp. J223]